MDDTLRQRRTWPQESDSSLSIVSVREPLIVAVPAVEPVQHNVEHSDVIPTSAGTRTNAREAEAKPPIGPSSAPSLLQQPDEDENDDEDNGAVAGTLLPSKTQQLKWTLVLYAVMLLLSGALFFYIYETLVAIDSRLGPSLQDPTRTVLLVSALSQGYVLLLHLLLSSIFNSLRWQLAARDAGVGAATFLGLSRATSLWAVLVLMRRGILWAWGFHRIVIAGLLLFISVVLKVHLTFPYIFNPTNSISVLAGLAPLNITFLESGIVSSSTVAIYFSGWVASIKWVSKYTIEVEPVICTQNCSSIFLPGGMELARFLTTNLNTTLTIGDFFDGADAVIINDAPGYHLEFFPKDPEFLFNTAVDCMTFGQLRGQGLYMCVASHDESTLVVGWSICPSAIFNNNNCFSNTSWTVQPLQQTTSMLAFKRYATVAYDRENFTILSVESISSPEPITYKASDFRNIFSSLFTNNLNDMSDNSIMADAMLIQIGWLLRLYQDDYSDDQESPLNFLRDMLIIPIQFSTAAWLFANATVTAKLETLPPEVAMFSGMQGTFALPPDMVTTASSASMTPRVIASPWTVYLFISLASALYLWAGTILLWVLRQVPAFPNTSGFIEVDISSKLGRLTAVRHRRAADDGTTPYVADFSSILRECALGNAESTQIARALKGKRVRVQALYHRARNERSIVLTMVGDARGDDIELVDGSHRDAALEDLISGSSY